MDTGKAIKIALAQRGMKQRQLAEKMGVNPVYICRICNKTSIGMSALKSVAKALDISVLDLMKLGEDEQ